MVNARIFHVTDEFLLFLLKHFSLIFKLKTCWLLSLFYPKVFTQFEIGPSGTWCGSLSCFGMCTLRTYILKFHLFWPGWNLGSYSGHNELHLIIAHDVLKIVIISKIILTYSRFISPCRPLIKSSIFPQLRHFFRCSSGVTGLNYFNSGDGLVFDSSVILVFFIFLISWLLYSSWHFSFSLRISVTGGGR